MNHKVEWTLAYGYRIEERKTETDVEQAYQLLLKQPDVYSSAWRKENAAVLTGHVIVCPFCNHEEPAYRHFPEPDSEEWDEYKNELTAWASQQLSLFEALDEEKYLHVQRVDRPGERWVCPHCGHEIKEDTDQRAAVLESDDTCLRISCDLNFLVDIYLMEWLPQDEWEIDSLQRETVEFCFSSGHTFLYLYDTETQEVLNKRDITWDYSDWIGSPTYEVIRRFSMVRSALAAGFREFWGTELPFSEEEWAPERFLEMTCFIGYPKDYYYAIPYAIPGNRIDETFQSVCAGLHHASQAREYLKACSLPNSKSVRRTIYNNPGLLFYISELEQIWEIIKDPNLFCRILSKRNMEPLWLLHMYPTVLIFLQDYEQICGKQKLVRQLDEACNPFFRYGLRYACMTPTLREKEHTTWQDREWTLRELLISSYSYPMGKVADETIRNCVINGYEFCWLRSFLDYHRAGTELENCLTEWYDSERKVLVIRKDGKCRAAVEIDDRTIRQARGKQNRDLYYPSDLLDAFGEWMEKYHLEWIPDEEE